MRCLSCQQECPSTQLQIFDKLLLCPSCSALAEKADTEIDREISRAREMTRNWLQQHIMRGGLLRGGDGGGLQRRTQECLGPGLRDVLHGAEVPGMRSPEGGSLPGNRDPSGDSADPLRGG